MFTGSISWWAKAIILTAVAIISVTSLTSISPRQTPAPQQPEIPFGLVASQNGDLKPWGEDSVKGTQLAIDEFNASGGLDGRKVKLFVEDSNSRPDVAREVAEKLASTDKVILLLGEIASGLTMQMGQVAADHEIPLISIAATRTSLFSGHSNMFRVCYTDDMQGPAMATFAYRDLGFRRVGVMTDRKQPYSTGLSDGFTTRFTELGGKVVDEEFYETGQTQFQGQIGNMKARKPDGLFLSGYFNEAGAIVRQARELGVNVKCMGGDGWDSNEILQLGGEAILNSYFCNHFNNLEESPEAKSFIAKWKAKYDGTLPNTSIGALAYDAAKLACDALKRAKTKDAAGLQAAIEDTVGFRGATGVITLKGKQGNPPKRVVIVKLTKEGQQFVKAFEADAITGHAK